jgi:hypothetical protein
MRCYLWDTDVSKLLGSYHREEDALEMVRTLTEHYGDDYAECLALGREELDGTALEPISGDELLKRAKGQTTAVAAAGRI